MSTTNNVASSIPASFQASLASGQLNSAIVFTFLSGIYSIVYVTTMYLHIFKMPTKSRNITPLAALTLLYVLAMVQLGIQWYYVNLAFVTNGETRLSVFETLLDRGSIEVFVLFETTFCLMFIISDALLIWRCYHVWGMSIRIIVLPVACLLGEIGKSFIDLPRTRTDNPMEFLGLSLALTVLSPKKTSINVPNTFKDLTGPQAFASFGTTALCTLLIGYQIHKAAYNNSHSHAKRSTQQFAHIIKVIIESAAVYSALTLVYAVQAAVPIQTDTLLNSPLLVEGFYLQPIMVVVAGMAPTVIATRIALTIDSRTTVQHMSNMDFQSQQESSTINTSTIDMI